MSCKIVDNGRFFWGIRNLGGRCACVFTLFFIFQRVVTSLFENTTIGDVKILNQKGYKSWEI